MRALELTTLVAVIGVVGFGIWEGRTGFSGLRSQSVVATTPVTVSNKPDKKLAPAHRKTAGKPSVGSHGNESSEMDFPRDGGPGTTVINRAPGGEPRTLDVPDL